MPGSIVHAPRGEDSPAAQQSLCGGAENPTTPWSGVVGTTRTMNCAACADEARRLSTITP